MANGQAFELVVDIAEDGTVETLVKGVKGSGCHALQEMFDGLGTELEHHTTAEFAQRAPVSIGTKTSRWQQVGN